MYVQRAEAEFGGLFLNAKEACSIRVTLEELGHKQPPTPIVTDNDTATGIATDTVKQKRSKEMDMRFYWIRDRVRQEQFYVYWRKGLLNKADYFTKHHPPSHHQLMRPVYLYDKNNPDVDYFQLLESQTRGSNKEHVTSEPAQCEGVLKPCPSSQQSQARLARQPAAGEPSPV